MVKHGTPFWVFDALVGVAGVGYVTVKVVSGPVASWFPAAAYAVALAIPALLALCYWSLRVTAAEKARGER